MGGEAGNWTFDRKRLGLLAFALCALQSLAWGQETPPEQAHPYDGLSGKAFWQAVERDRMSPTQMPGATGSFHFPSPHGPFRNDPEQGIPDHAYSPFDREEILCPSGGCDYEPGVLLVRFKAGVSVSHQRGSTPRFNSDGLNTFFADLPVQQVRRLFPTARPPEPGARVTRPDGQTIPLPDLTRWHRIELAPDAQRNGQPVEVQELMRSLRTMEDLDYVEPDYQYKTEAGADPQSDPQASNRAGTRSARNFYTDPDVAQQWHLEAANIPNAWQFLEDNGLPSGGSSDVVVAVIDTGVDYDHPDLAGSMWINQAELNGTPGQDSDGNGYVDDIHGATVLSNAPSGDPMDDHGHGTHVAGIIAAQGNNNEGGVGVAPNVKIMAIKAAQYSGILNSSDIAAGIIYAMDNGADVINMSFGGYARSQAVEDALANAFGFAVLVAAAGNDGRVNLPCPFGANMYPAAYNWVLGVMSRNQFPNADGDHLSGFSNYDCSAKDLQEYEVMAPGAGIYSTLPFGGYGAWSGTSMATPVVAGMAALARTRWPEKAVYSSRFIMGQLAATGPMLQAYTPPRSLPVSYRNADALQTLSSVPQPELAYMEHWLFDTTDVHPDNNPNGIVDAGETIDLAVVIRNHWGKADNVQVKLEAWAPGAIQPDPWVEMLVDTVDYGAVGSFNQKSNGFLVDEDDVPIGVVAPFQFRTLPNTPNDHLIVFRLTITANNGFDATAAPVVTESYFHQLVQSGTELPRLIDQDMTLDDSRLWLIPNGVMVQEGATLTIGPGARVQFFSADPSDPFAESYQPQLQVEGRLNVAGTAEAPVDIFTGLLYQEYPVIIRPVGAATVTIDHARVVNPVIGYSSFYDMSSPADIPVTSISNSFFTQNISRCIMNFAKGSSPGYWANCSQDPFINAFEISSVVLRELGYRYSALSLGASSVTETLLDGVYSTGLRDSFENSVFLRNTRKPNHWDSVLNSAVNPVPSVHEESFLQFAFREEYNGYTYVAIAGIDLEVNDPHVTHRLVDRFAQSLGGNIVWIEDQAENDFVAGFVGTFNETNFNATHGDMQCGLPDCWVPFSGGSVMIGAVRDSQYPGSAPFRWFGGQLFVYENWVDSALLSNYGWHARLGSNGLWYPGNARRTHPFLIKLPGSISKEDLAAARETFITQRRYGMVDNAFLNNWRDMDSDHWLRFIMGGGPDEVASIAHNFWGTESTTLIDAAIIDFNDNFNLGTVHYQPILTQPPESAYPFVVDVEVSNSLGVVSQVGAEDITFTVSFNRDMDTGVEPLVSFGPDVPYTDFIISGQWTDPRTWVGEFTTTPVTGDGWQYIRVIGAVAADNPWLVTGNDYGRFRFEVVTSGTEAMSLQASGAEGLVSLLWGQDDFDLLAGYQLYRSTSADGTFERINATVIPQGMTTWEDTNVEPGQPYFYKFTVVKTDLTESDFSNVASATPLDTIFPSIQHTPVTSAAAGQPLTIRADVTDNVSVQSVTLLHRPLGSGDNYQSRAMTLSSGDRYSATLEASLVQSPGIEYYIEASDGLNQTRSTSPASPHGVAVDDQPTVTAISPAAGPAAGGTEVTITGSNFQDGLSVLVGSAPCTSLVLDSTTSLRCTTGQHIPDLVDVRVTNPTGSPGIRARAFTYQSDTAFLSLPNVVVGLNDSIELPLAAAEIDGMVSASFTISFDPTVVTSTGARVGNLTPGWSLQANTSQPGQLTVSMATGSGSVTGSGVLAQLAFDVVGQADAVSSLTISNVELNGGAVASDVQHGSVTVDSVYAVGGTVTYWNANTRVPDARMTLSGDQNLISSSGEDGSFSINAPAGNHTLTPSRDHAENGISALDASMVLQHASGIATMTGQAATAADVDRSGTVNAHDAYLILRQVVGLSTLPFQNAEKVWLFTPESRSYSNLAANQTGQDFTAILLGDPSGNWSASEARVASRAGGTTSFELTAGEITSGEEFSVPLSVTETSGGFHSLELELSFDGTVFSALGIDDLGLPSNWSMAYNVAEDGVVRIALAGSTALSAAADLLAIRFLATGQDGDSSDLQVRKLEVDEGQVSGVLNGTVLRIGRSDRIFHDHFGG